MRISKLPRTLMRYLSIVIGFVLLNPSFVWSSSQIETTALMAQAMALKDEGKYSDAIPLALHDAVAQAEKQYGSESDEAIALLEKVAEIYEAGGLSSQVAKVRTQITGKATIKRLHDQARKVSQARLAAQIDSMMEKASQKASASRDAHLTAQTSAGGSPESASPPGLTQTGTSGAGQQEWSLLMQKATMLSYQGKVQEAIPFASEAAQKAKEVFGAGSQNERASLGLLSTLYQRTDVEKSKAIQEQLRINSAGQSPKVRPYSSNPNTPPAPKTDSTQPAENQDLKAREEVNRKESEWAQSARRAGELEREGKYKELAPIAQELADQAAGLFGPAHPNTKQALGMLFKAYKYSGQPDKANAVFARNATLLSEQQASTAPKSGRPGPDGLTHMMEQMRAMGTEKLAAGPIEQQTSNAAKSDTPGVDAQTLALNQMLEKAMEQIIDSSNKKLEALSRQQAESAKDHSVMTDPDLSQLQGVEKLVALTSRGRYLEALPLVEKEAKGASGSMAVMHEFNLAQLYMRLAMYDKAKSVFKKLLDQTQHDEKQRQQNESASLEKLKNLQNSVSQASEAMGEAMSRTSPGASEYFKKRAAENEARIKQLEDRNKAQASKPSGPEADYAYNLAQIYQKMARYDEARQYYQQAAESSAQGYAPRTSSILMDQILLYMEVGDYAKAKSLAQAKIAEATGVNWKRYEGSDAQRAILLVKQAQVHMAFGQFQEAEQVLQNGLKLWKENVHDGQELHLMNRLAQVYRASGKYSEAQGLYEEAIKLFPQLINAIPPDGASVLSDLAQLQQELGMYHAAKVSHEKALEIQKQALGADHPETLATLIHLGQLFDEEGEYEKAKEFLEEAKKGFEMRLGERHPETVSSTMQLARLYHRQGNHQAAKVLLENVLRVREEIFLPEHLDIAATLSDLAGVHLDLDQPAKARELYGRALTIYQKVLGAEHQESGQVYKALGDVALLEQHLENAEKHYVKAQLSFEKSVGPTHPATASALVGLGRVKILQNQPKAAFELLQRAVAIESPALFSQLGTVREARKLELLQRAAYTKDLVISLVERNLSDDSRAVRFALELFLERKGLVFDDQARLQDALSLDNDPSLVKKWMVLKQRVTWLELHPPIHIPSDVLRKLRQDAQAELERTEVDLAAKSQSFAVSRATRRFSAGQIQETLQKSVLIEFLHIPDFDWKTLRLTTDNHYIAFVVRPAGSISLVPLGNASTIEEVIRQFRNSVKGKGLEPTASLEKAKKLHQLIWKPLMPALGQAQSVILSPDGEINHVPFASLLNYENGKFLIESLDISYVTSGKDLLRPSREIAGKGKAILVANPSFGGSPGPSRLSRDSDELARPRDFTGEFMPLPGTKREAEAISRLLPGPAALLSVLTEGHAQEQTILEASRPKILHLATHGYFLKNDTPIFDRALMSNSAGSDKETMQQPENVLLRSGLALAGANEAKLASTSMDGLLTAYEVSGMNLHGTDLVTLSACETGIGEVKNGDGVYGLRRSFALAGARHLVMSLWKVDDEMTATQMEMFYRAYGKEGMEPKHALRTAQLEMISKLKKERGVAAPALWAAFIVQGIPNLSKTSR